MQTSKITCYMIRNEFGQYLPSPVLGAFHGFTSSVLDATHFEEMSLVGVKSIDSKIKSKEYKWVKLTLSWEIEDAQETNASL